MLTHTLLFPSSQMGSFFCHKTGFPTFFLCCCEPTSAPAVARARHARVCSDHLQLLAFVHLFKSPFAASTEKLFKNAQTAPLKYKLNEIHFKFCNLGAFELLRISTHSGVHAACVNTTSRTLSLPLCWPGELRGKMWVFSVPFMSRREPWHGFTHRDLFHRNPAPSEAKARQ